MSLELARGHIALMERLSGAVTRGMVRAWRRLPGHDEADVEPFLAIAIPLILAGQRQAVVATDAYIARSLERPALGIDPRDLIGAAVRNGTAPEEAYRRPFVQHWTALKESTPYEQSVEASAARVEEMAATDVQLAQTHTLRVIAQEDTEIVGYRRVTDGDACALCQIAATQRYHSGDLMPIHGRCGCSVQPIIGAEDPGRVIDRAALKRLRADGEIAKITAQRQHARAREEAAAAVEQHGEIGPVLVDPSHHFALLR